VTEGTPESAGRPARAGRTRQLPLFYCPYCGDEELSPHGDEPPEWHCASCLRTFSVQLTGTGVNRV